MLQCFSEGTCLYYSFLYRPFLGGPNWVGGGKNVDDVRLIQKKLSNHKKTQTFLCLNAMSTYS